MLMPNARCFRAAVVCANQLVTGECAGQPLSHEKADIPGADAVRYAEGHTLTGPAEVIGDQMVAAMDAVGVDGAILVSPFSCTATTRATPKRSTPRIPIGSGWSSRSIRPIPRLPKRSPIGRPPRARSASVCSSGTMHRRTPPIPPSTHQPRSGLGSAALAAGQLGVHRRREAMSAVGELIHTGTLPGHLARTPAARQSG